MISAWWLLLIIPACICMGFWAKGLCECTSEETDSVKRHLIEQVRKGKGGV